MHLVPQGSQPPAPVHKTFAGDSALAAKYARPGPRYTSYPTAPQFDDAGAVARCQDWLQSQSGAPIPPLSLYVHLPFCRDICYYCACNKVVTRDDSAADAYLQRLEREIEQRASLHGARRPVTQLHWGGGTPTFLEAADLTRLMHQLASHFHLLDRPEREYSIEIDPRTVDTDKLALLKGLGFNRISLGIQDFDPLVQKAINRLQPFGQVAQIVDSVRRLGFTSLGFDLIYGLPHQDRQSMTETLARVIALRPDRIACFNYAHLPGRFASQRAIDRLQLPSPAEKLQLQQQVSRGLCEAGYVHIGMDHFVLPGDELAVAQARGRLQRNFQGYAVHLADDLVGLGVSAISQVGDFYLQNERELEQYYRRIDAGETALSRGCQLSAEDRLRRFVIMSLACDLRLDIEECERRFEIDFARHFAAELPRLQSLAEDGLVTFTADYIRVTGSGRAFLRNICMLFDAYLPQAGGEPNAQYYSATV